jgi:hypothetical protein
MTVFIVLENADVEIIGLHVFAQLIEADRCFDRLCQQNLVADDVVLIDELSGTLRIAGDDAYAVQLLHRGTDSVTVFC